jgi:hypothetical protein
MSHIICPLCGFNRPTTGFNPSDYEYDLKLRDITGQGRGQDFIRVDFSVLGDDVYSPMIANRCLDLIQMFVNADVLKIQDILEKLKVTDSVAFLQKELFNMNDLLNKEKREKEKVRFSAKMDLDREKRENIDLQEKMQKKLDTQDILFQLLCSNIFTVECARALGL